MASETLCEYNVLFRNTRATIAGDVRELGGLASLLVLNEATPEGAGGKGVADGVRDLGWKLFTGERGDNVIAWDPRVWQPDVFKGNRQVAPSAAEWGLPAARFNPPRYVLWHGFTHRATGTRHLVYGTHVTAGYARPEGQFSEGLEDYKDDSAMHHMLWLVSTVARHMLAHRDYEHHHLLGDLNAQQRKEGVWWYPARILDGLFVADTLPRSIDYVLHSHRSVASGLRVRKRWSARLHSDHPAHLKTVTFK